MTMSIWDYFRILFLGFSLVTAYLTTPTGFWFSLMAGFWLCSEVNFLIFKWLTVKGHTKFQLKEGEKW